METVNIIIEMEDGGVMKGELYPESRKDRTRISKVIKTKPSSRTSTEVCSKIRTALSTLSGTTIISPV